MNNRLTYLLQKGTCFLFRILLLIIFMSYRAYSAPSHWTTFEPKTTVISEKNPDAAGTFILKSAKATTFAETGYATTCGVLMQDSVVGYTKSSTNNQIFYLLTVKNTGLLRDSFNFSYTSTSTPLYTFIETVSGTTITATPGIEPGASYSFIIRFVVPAGSPAETTNYTNLVATSSVCGASGRDTTHLLTHLYSGRATTGDSCDVQVSKTANVGTIASGGTITYTISIINNLPGLANDVFIIDTLASSLVYQSSAVTVVPSGYNYSLSYNATSHIVQFRSLSALGQSQPITFTITVKTLCTAVPSVVNKALVTSSTYDNNSSNDWSSVTTNVNISYSAPTAPGVTSCYNSTALLTASGAGSGKGYKWYTTSSGGTSLTTGSTYTTPVLNSSTSYYVAYYNIDTAVCEGPRTAVPVTVKTAPVVGSPSGTTVCPNDAATFTESATGTSLTYQWQVSTNSGSTWTSLTNSSTYSGVTTATLGISNTTYSMNGYQYLCNVASGGCTNTISSTSATLTVRKSYTWLGVNTNWDDPVNWCSGIPDSSSDVTIPSGLTYYPVITGTASTHDIYTGSGTTVTLDSGTIRIFGTVTNNGLYDARTGTINMKGSSSQTIAGSMFNNKTILNLVDGNTGSAGLSVSSASADTLKISGTLSFGTDSSKLNTGNNIDLLSTVSTTANVGIVGSNNTITGQVIVDRYINMGSTGQTHPKAWQLLSTPTLGQTVKESWMENGSLQPGYGTQITSPSGTSHGFDYYSPAIALKYYNPTNNNWIEVSSANDVLYNPNGYLLFLRGDRTIASPYAAATPTILRSKGTLICGNTAPISVMPDHFQSVGNPYASNIDFTKVTKDAGVDDLFYAFDPYLFGSYGFGGYQTVSSVNDWKAVPGGTFTYQSGIPKSVIQSGQAFFVHGTSIASLVKQTYNVSFTENCKVSEKTTVNFTRTAPRAASEEKEFMRASLYSGTGSNKDMADGNAVAFSSLYSDKLDQNDAIKMTNAGENFGLLRYGRLLAIEARAPVTLEDTLFYYISNVRQQTYQLCFAPENMEQSGLQPVLIDAYTNVYTPLSLQDTTLITVSFTSAAASRATNRFRMVFRQMSSLPISFTSLNASVSEEGVIIRWKTVNEGDLIEYEIQHSTDGTNFETTGTVAVNQLNNGNYTWFPAARSAGNQYYRICMIDAAGNITYSQVIRVTVPPKISETPHLAVSPNPAINGTLGLRFSNEPAGDYRLRLLNSIGQIVYLCNVSFMGGSGFKTIHPPKLPNGVYQLECIRPDKKQEVIKVIY